MPKAEPRKLPWSVQCGKNSWFQSMRCRTEATNITSNCVVTTTDLFFRSRVQLNPFKLLCEGKAPLSCLERKRSLRLRSTKHELI